MVRQQHLVVMVMTNQIFYYSAQYKVLRLVGITLSKHSWTKRVLKCFPTFIVYCTV